MKTERESQKRQFYVVWVIVFLGFIGISAPYLIFPPLFLNAEYSFLPAIWGKAPRAFFLGLTLAVYPLGQFIGSPILGALSDDYGRRRLLTGSLIIASFCNVLTGFAIAWEHLSLLIISRFVAGLMEGNVAIARAMCADFKTLSKHDTFGKMNAAISIAYLIGPFVGGMLTDKNLFSGFNTSTPFFFISILFITLACLSALILKETNIIAKGKIPSLWQRFNFIAKLKILFRNKKLKVLLISSTCFTLAVDIFYEFGPVYLTDKWTLGPTELILYNAMICIGLAIGNGWLPVFVSKRFSINRAIGSAIFGFALFLTLIILTNTSIPMLVWCGLAGLSIGLAVTLLTVKISDAVSDNVQGEVMGSQLSLRVLGNSIICLSGGILLMLSSKIILAIAAVTSLVAMIYYHSNRF